MNFEAVNTNVNSPSPLVANLFHGPRLLPNLNRDRIDGIMIGIALGDSLGLPVETLTQSQINAQFGRVTTFQSLEFNTFLNGLKLPKGSFSDDAQLTAAIFKAYSDSGGFSLAGICQAHIDAYNQSSAGWGGSTVAGVQALLKGLTPDQEEFKQALKTGKGNGIPMKVAAVGAWLAAHPVDFSIIVEQITAICSISHPTSVSVSAGLAHVAALHYCLTHNQDSFQAETFIDTIIEASALGRNIYPETRNGDDLTERLMTLKEIYHQNDETIISAYGGGDCYVYNSLPFAYAFFLRSPTDIRSLYDVINAGGDTDSNAAMVGGLLGALMGKEIFPQELVTEIHQLQSLMDVAESFFMSAQEHFE